MPSTERFLFFYPWKSLWSCLYMYIISIYTWKKYGFFFCSFLSFSGFQFYCLNSNQNIQSKPKYPLSLLILISVRMKLPIAITGSVYAVWCSFKIMFEIKKMNNRLLGSLANFFFWFISWDSDKFSESIPDWYLVIAHEVFAERFQLALIGSPTSLSICIQELGCYSLAWAAVRSVWWCFDIRHKALPVSCEL